MNLINSLFSCVTVTVLTVIFVSQMEMLVGNTAAHVTNSQQLSIK